MARIELDEREQQALAAWVHLLGPGRVLFGEHIPTYYDRSKKRNIVAVLFPTSTNEVVEIVRVAARFHTPLYPISKGYNYGYGGAMPSAASCAVVDLSRMNRIRSMDEEIGAVTVEPGVTTGDLRRFLKERRLPFLSPAVGIGPRASLVGNVLEKGRSVTPHVDRMSSLVSLEAVLPDGSIYSSAFSSSTVPFFKWGLGPYLDGLFVQNNIGIVTAATFALAHRPENVVVFSTRIQNHDALAGCVDALRDARHVLGNTCPVISIQTPERILMSGSFATESIEDGLQLANWHVFGTLQGDPGMVRAARRRLKSIFRAHSQPLSFYTRSKLCAFNTLHRYLHSVPLWRRYMGLVPKINSFFDIAVGDPLYFPEIDLEQPMLFTPVVLPWSGARVAAFALEAREVCAVHHQPFVATILNFSPLSVLVSILLRAESNREASTQEMHTCYRALQKKALQNGGYVYRASIDTMDAVVGGETFWRTAERIKRELDPQRIIAPGRYDVYKK